MFNSKSVKYEGMVFPFGCFAKINDVDEFRNAKSGEYVRAVLERSIRQHYARISVDGPTLFDMYMDLHALRNEDDLNEVSEYIDRKNAFALEVVQVNELMTRDRKEVISEGEVLVVSGLAKKVLDMHLRLSEVTKISR